MPLRTTPSKALAQIQRRDPEGVTQYRAELRYFHVPQRAVLGMSTALAYLDETHTIPIYPNAAMYAQAQRPSTS